MPNNTSNQLSEKERELVLARLETVSPEIYFSSGNGSSISRDRMIEHIKNNDTEGKEFIETEMEFLRALKNGQLLKEILEIQSSGISLA